jgi:hypothetical protein
VSELEPTQVNMQAVFAELQATPDGRNELEKAINRATIVQLREQVAALSNGQGPDPGRDPDLVPADEPAVE